MPMAPQCRLKDLAMIGFVDWPFVRQIMVFPRDNPSSRVPTFRYLGRTTDAREMAIAKPR